MKNIILKLAATLFLLVVLPLAGLLKEAAVDSLSAKYTRTLKTKGPKAAEKLLKKHNTLSCSTHHVKSGI